MSRSADLLLTAAAPAIWGSTYVVTTLMLPQGYPLTVAMLRALPAGLLLLLAVRQLPHGIWWLRTAILGALNFSVFWALLFVAAYRLPGGVAATLGAVREWQMLQDVTVSLITERRVSRPWGMDHLLFDRAEDAVAGRSSRCVSPNLRNGVGASPCSIVSS
ncbi:MAG: hypothetical protein KBO59_26975, partial [Achromobacter sp.]|nr:hypothetical protein [Achromobacter sp.]